MSNTIRNLLVKTGVDLSGLTKGFNKAAKDLKAAGKKMTDVGTSMTKGITAPILGLGVGVAAIATKAGDAADEIITLSNKFGITTDSVQELQYAARFLDVEFDTMTSTQQKLTKNMDLARDGADKQKEAFNKLGVEYRNNDGTLKNAKDVWLDAIDALGGIKSEADRDAIAMTLFGKSAADLNPLIVAGSDELKRLSEEAHNVGAVMSGDDLTALGKFDDAMESLQAVFQTVVGELATAFLPALNALLPVIKNDIVPAVKTFAGWISDLITWFKDLSPETKKFVGLVVGLAVAIGPLLTVAGKLVTTVGNISKGLGAATKAIGAGKGLLGGITAFLGPAGTMVAVIGAAVLAIGAIIIAVTSADDKMAKLAAKVRDINAAVDTANKTFEDANTEIDLNAKLANKLTDELYDLQENEDDSNEKKARMKTLVKQLNEMYPKLNLLIDKETGLLDKNKDAVKDVIEQKKIQLELEAREEQIKNIIKAKVEAEEAYKEAVDNLTGSVGEHSQAEIDSAIAIAGVKGPMDKNVVVYKDTKAALDKTNGSLDTAMQGYDDLARTVVNSGDDIGDANDDMKRKEQELADERAEALAKYMTAIEAQRAAAQQHREDMADIIQQHLDDMGSATDTEIKKIKLTPAQWKKNLEQQTKDFKHWIDDMNALVGKVPSAMLKELEDMGPGYRELIEGLADMSDEELKEVVDAWKAKGKAAADGFLGPLEGSNGGGGHPETSALGGGGSGSGSGVKAGIKSILSSMKSTLDNDKSVVKAARSLGKALIEGWKAGMSSKLPSLLSLARTIARSVIAAMRAALAIHSPSKETESDGKNYIGGLALGIKKNGFRALQEARNLASGLNGVFSNMQIQSFSIPRVSPALSLSDSPSMGSYGTGAKTPLVVPLYINGKEFARATVDDISAAQGTKISGINRGNGNG